MSKIYYAVYSQKQQKRCGSSIYRRADGTEVEVTEVNVAPNFSYFDDAQDRGQVVECVRTASETKGYLDR